MKGMTVSFSVAMRGMHAMLLARGSEGVVPRHNEPVANPVVVWPVSCGKPLCVTLCKYPHGVLHLSTIDSWKTN